MKSLLKYIPDISVIHLIFQLRWYGSAAYFIPISAFSLCLQCLRNDTSESGNVTVLYYYQIFFCRPSDFRMALFCSYCKCNGIGDNFRD